MAVLVQCNKYIKLYHLVLYNIDIWHFNFSFLDWRVYLGRQYEIYIDLLFDSITMYFECDKNKNRFIKISACRHCT